MRATRRPTRLPEGPRNGADGVRYVYGLRNVYGLRKRKVYGCLVSNFLEAPNLSEALVMRVLARVPNKSVATHSETHAGLLLPPWINTKSPEPERPRPGLSECERRQPKSFAPPSPDLKLQTLTPDTLKSK